MNHFFYDLFLEEPEEPINTINTINKKKQIHHIVDNTFLITNEREKTRLLKQLPNWQQYFYLCNKAEPLRIAEVADDFVPCAMKCNEVLLSYDSRKLIYIDSYLKALRCSRKYIIKIIDFYKSTLVAIQILNGKGIVHNNINFNTLLIEEENENILLTNFTFSLSLNQAKNDELNLLMPFYTADINKDQDLDIFLPVEFHLLRYQLDNGLTCLSAYNIETVLRQFVVNHRVLKHFDTRQLLKEGLSYFNKYVNRNLLETMASAFETWDNYALSIVFLRILIGLHKTVKINNKFIILFMKLLFRNISLDVSTRLSLNDTREQFEILLNKIELDDFVKLVHSI